MYAYRLNENNKTNHLGGFVLIFSIFLVRKKNIPVFHSHENTVASIFPIIFTMLKAKLIFWCSKWGWKKPYKWSAGKDWKQKNQLKCIEALDHFCFVLFPYGSDFQFIYIHNVSCNVRLYTICIAFVVSTQTSTQWRKKLIWDEDGWLHYVRRVFSNSLNNTSEFPAMTEKYLTK